jgi:transcriptional regulator with XRE-family HTH domain
MNASNGNMVLADGLGEFLRRERELRHISLDDIAERTKISRRYLEAIEEGQYERLPGETFVRGFIRSYAQTIGLDPEDTILIYSQTRVVPRVTPQRRERIAPERRAWNERVLQWVLVAGVVAVGVALLGVVGVLEVPNLLWFASTPPVDVGKAPMSTVPLILTAIAEADTWLRVTIDGRDVQNMLLRAGQSAKWMGQEHFVISIGNVRATRLRLNGHELTMPQTSQSILRHYTISRDMLR